MIMQHWDKNWSPSSQAETKSAKDVGPTRSSACWLGDRGDLASDEHTNFAAELISSSKASTDGFFTFSI